MPVPDGVAGRRLGGRHDALEPADGAERRRRAAPSRSSRRQAGRRRAAGRARRIRSTIGRSSSRGGLSRIRRGELGEERRGVHLLDLCDGRRAHDRGPARPASRVRGAERRAARSASWTACASAHPPSPSTCVEPAIRTIRVGAAIGSAPRRRAAPARARPGDRVGAGPGAGRAGTHRGEHVGPQVHQRQRVEAAVRLGHGEQHRAVRRGRARPSCAACPRARAGAGRRRPRQLAGVHERVRWCPHQCRSGARAAVIHARMRSISTSG